MSTGSNKQYDGYQSYDYLDAETDYNKIDVADMFSGFDSHEIGLSTEEAKRVEKLAADETVMLRYDHPFHFRQYSGGPLGLHP